MANNVYIDNNILPFPLVPKSSYKLTFICYEGYPMEYIGNVSWYIEPIEGKK